MTILLSNGNSEPAFFCTSLDCVLLFKITFIIVCISGLSVEEFDKFMKRVPTHLRTKFKAIANDFAKFDTNQDDIIDSDEFGAMLDQVMKKV